MYLTLLKERESHLPRNTSDANDIGGQRSAAAGLLSIQLLAPLGHELPDSGRWRVAAVAVMNQAIIWIGSSHHSLPEDTE